jgi:hypothetical protein
MAFGKPASCARMDLQPAHVFEQTVDDIMIEGVEGIALMAPSRNLLARSMDPHDARYFPLFVAHLR